MSLCIRIGISVLVQSMDLNESPSIRYTSVNWLGKLNLVDLALPFSVTKGSYPGTKKCAAYCDENQP